MIGSFEYILCNVDTVYNFYYTMYSLSGVLYTGLANGKIVSIRGKVRCASEETCGRPLGVRIHNGPVELPYVVNAYKGQFFLSVNL